MMQERELDLIRSLQQFDLQWLMQGLTLAGYGELYLGIIMLVYWCIAPAAGLRLGLFLLLSSACNQLLKIGFHEPRPYWLQADLLVGRGDAAAGMPSGHAQGAMVFWFTLARWLSGRWAWLLAGMLVFAIGVSRIWLGAHFPHQVLAGWLVGLVLLVVLQSAEQPFLRLLRQDAVALQLLTCFLASAAFVALGILLHLRVAVDWELPRAWYQNALAADMTVAIRPLGLKGLMRDGGLLFGLAGGAVMNHAVIGLRVLSGRRWLAFGLGVAGAGLLWYAMGQLCRQFYEGPAWYGLHALRGTLLGCWISLGWPLLWHRVTLRRSEQEGAS